MSRLAPVRHLPGGHVMVLERPDRAGATPYVGTPGPSAPRVPTGLPVARPPRRVGHRRPSPRALQRRRQVFATLVGTVVATTAGGLAFGGFAWVLFLMSYVALFGYVAVLVQLRSRRDDLHAKVRQLPAQPPRRPSTGVIVHSARGA